MANDYTAEVLRYLRRKDSSGFEPITWLGSEQRFVGALRNSGVNNLEEQYVLGTDTYTISYTDSDGNDIIEKSFCITPSGTLDGVTDYYKIISTIYNNGDPDAEYIFDGDTLKFTNTANDVAFGDGSSDYPDLKGLYLLNNETFDFNEDSFRINPSSSSSPVSRKDELYFIKLNEDPILVLTKLTSIGFTSDGKKVVREQIINAINP